MIDVFLLLGSNLGDRKMLLNEAIQRIEADVAPVLQASFIYETQSWGKADAPDYLNQVLLLQTEITAQQVLEKILAIELSMGRKREEKWGSRIIDIDILFYGHAIIDEPDLKVPHPELHNRRFTLQPLAELAPEFEHPLIKKNILQLKSELIDDLVVKKV